MSYIPPLFFLPYLLAPGSAFARYHANQGLLLTLYSVIVYALSFLLLFLGPLLAILVNLLYLAGLILFLFGVVNAAQGKRAPLPVIGSITLLKA